MKGRSYKKVVEAELETLPLMSLFIVIIPMLLLSAVFLEISVIDMSLPEAEASEASPKEALNLTVRIEEDGFRVEANGHQAVRVARESAHATAEMMAALEAIKTKHPEHRSVIIACLSDTRYEDVVWVMDVTRAAALPDVSLLGEN